MHAIMKKMEVKTKLVGGSLAKSRKSLDKYDQALLNHYITYLNFDSFLGSCGARPWGPGYEPEFRQITAPIRLLR